MKASIQFTIPTTDRMRATINIATVEGSGQIEAGTYDLLGEDLDVVQSPENLRKLGQELIKLADFAEGKVGTPSPFFVNYPPGVR